MTWEELEDMGLADGPSGLCPSSTPGPAGADPPGSGSPASMEAALQQIFHYVDGVDELRGAGVIFVLSDSEQYVVREPQHISMLGTYVVADFREATLRAPPRGTREVSIDQGWWDQWGEVVTDCGGFAVSAAIFGAGLSLEVPTAGASTVLLIVGAAGIAAEGGQCGLAIARATSSGFRAFEAEHRGTFEDVEAALELVALAGSIASARAAVRSGGEVITRAPRYQRYVGWADGAARNTHHADRVVGALNEMARLRDHIGYFGRALDRFLEQARVSRFSSPVFTRYGGGVDMAMRYVTRQIRRAQLTTLAQGINSAVSATMHARGLLQEDEEITATVYLVQEPIFGDYTDDVLGECVMPEE